MTPGSQVLFKTPQGRILRGRVYLAGDQTVAILATTALRTAPKKNRVFMTFVVDKTALL